LKFLLHLRVLFLLISVIPFAGWAQNIPDQTNPPHLVNDFADVLSDEQEREIEQKLMAYEDSTSTQIAVVLVKNLDGTDVADYAVKLALKWKIGTKKDNGVLFLAAIDDRKTRIEVGYGLEGVLPDITTKRILTEDVKPYFKQQQFYEGIDLATTHIIQAAKGEYKGEYKYSNNRGKKKGKGLGIGSIIFIIILIIVFASSRGGGGGGFLTGMILGNMLGAGGRHSSGGGWGDFSSGGGSFGGFGGGSFGGGGSSGDW
jgi:uncharacterized protein